MFEVAEGEVRIYPGNYEDYLWRISGKPLSSVNNGTGNAPAVPTLSDIPELKAAGRQRLNPMKLQKLKDRQKEIEEKLAALESQIAENERALGDFKSVQDTTRRSGEIEQSRAQADRLMAEWEELTQSIEASQ